MPTLLRTRNNTLYFILFIVFSISVCFNTKASTLTVSTNAINIGYEVLNYSFELKSDFSWTISSSDNWFYVYNSAGNFDQTIHISFKPNKLTTARTGFITISGGNLPNKVVTITQAGITDDAYEFNNTLDNATSINIAFNHDIADVIISNLTIHNATDIDYYKINLPSGYTYNIVSELLCIYNNTNLNYSILAKYAYKTNQNTWSNGSDKTRTYDFQVNNGGTAYFQIKATNPGEIGNYGLHFNITRSIGNPILNISTNNIITDFTKNSNSFVNLTSNINWKINNQCPWFTVNPESGSNNGKITISSDANIGINQRVDSFALMANGVITQYIHVIQPRADLKPDIYEPDNDLASAKELFVNFIDHQAKISTIGACIHSTNDIDYYKINLPQGSTYAISALLKGIDMDSSIAKISYKVGSVGVWSTLFNKKITDFTFAGGDFIYFKVEPAKAGLKSYYSLEITINKNINIPTLSTSTAILNIDANENSLSIFEIKSNSGWSILCDSSWISCSPSSGWGNATITVKALANITFFANTTNINVSCPTLPNNIISVTQTSMGLPLPDSYEPNDVESDAKELPLVFSNDSVSVKTVGANRQNYNDLDYYKIILPEGYNYFISSQLTAYKYNVNYVNAKFSLYTANEMPHDFVFNKHISLFSSGNKTYYIKIEPGNTGPNYNGITKEYGNYTLYLNIKRFTDNPEVFAGPSQLIINSSSNNSSNFDINSTEGTWTLKSDVPWLTVDKKTGTGNSTITLIADANDHISPRYATIGVYANGILYSHVDVTQNGMPYPDDVYENNDSEANAYTVDLAFNNNLSNFNTIDANINKSTDIDYFKINLPSGYNYKILPAFQFSGTRIFSYKLGMSGTWNTSNSNDLENPIINTDSDTVLFFKIEPFKAWGYDAEIGPYNIQTSISRTNNNSTLSKTYVLSNVLNFYPNPVTDKLKIELLNQNGKTNVLIYNSEGSIKSSEFQNDNNFEIDMSQYISGVYFVKITSAKGTQTIKVLKK